MIDTLLTIFHSKIALAAGVGALTAARIDYLAFCDFKSANDAVKYDWGIAAWRWFQGAVIGVVSHRMIA